MRQPLILHPQSRPGAVAGVNVDVEFVRPGKLALTFVAAGRVGEIVIPERATPSRADELWRQTCFEVFLRTASGGPYYEFNFSPSSQWAAYRFDDYRGGMRVAPYWGDPGLVTEANDDRLALSAGIELLQLPALNCSKSVHVGLSAILCEKSGNKTYWALAHPPGKPDFHHADGFAFNLSGLTP